MTEPTNPQSPETATSTLKDQMELLKFLKEESRASQEALDKRATADRELLKHTLWLVTAPLTVMLVIAGWLGYSSLANLKETIQQQAKIEGQKAIDDTTAQLKNDVRDKVDEQFQTPRIKQIIHDAAVDSTRDEAKPLIISGVKSQVAAQSQTIQRIAVQAVNDKVQSTIDPIAADLRLQGVVTSVNTDDAKAFDELLRIRANGTSEQRMRASAVITERYSHIRDQFPHGDISYCPHPLDIKYKTLYVSQDSRARFTTLFGCRDWWNGRERSEEWWDGNTQFFRDNPSPFPIDPLIVAQSLAPEFVEFALHDPSLSVRAAAVNGLMDLFRIPQSVPRDGFNLLDVSGLEDWWRTVEPNYRAIVILSRATATPFNLDRVQFYDALLSVKSSTPPTLRDFANKTLADMRARAESLHDIAEDKKKLGDVTCASVHLSFARQTDSWRTDPRIRVNENEYSTNEIEYLEGCSAEPKFLSDLVVFATKSQSLKTRYAATRLINEWVGTKLTPLDNAAILKWWSTQRAQN